MDIGPIETPDPGEVYPEWWDGRCPHCNTTICGAWHGGEKYMRCSFTQKHIRPEELQPRQETAPWNRVVAMPPWPKKE